MGNYYFAPSCSACPYGRGPDYCKGECKWDYNEKKCVPKYSTGNLNLSLSPQECLSLLLVLSSINNYEFRNESIPDIALIGPSDVGGACPEGSFEYKRGTRKYCCCTEHCCWSSCKLNKPPDLCLKAIPGAFWTYDDVTKDFKAFKSTWPKGNNVYFTDDIAILYFFLKRCL